MACSVSASASPIPKVDVGKDGIVAVTPNDGTAFTWDGIRVDRPVAHRLRPIVSVDPA